MTDRILVFVPMYNCRNQIPRVIAQFDARAKGLVHGLIVVDNQSTDGGREVAVEAVRALEGIDARVLRNDHNYGLGGSHKVAFQYALDHDYTHVVVLHGDDQGSLADLLGHLEAGEHRTADALLGARFHPDSSLPGYSAFRTLGNRVFNKLFAAVCGTEIWDLGSGLNLYRTEILADGFYTRFPDDLTFNYCMSMAHAHLHHDARFFPITWREDDQVSNVRLFSQAWRVQKMLASFALGRDAFLAAEHRVTPRDHYTAQRVDGVDA